jgi:hypothetical protein
MSISGGSYGSERQVSMSASEVMNGLLIRPGLFSGMRVVSVRSPLGV